MTAHATRLAGPIRRPAGRRPVPRGTRLVRVLVAAVLLVVVATSIWALVSSPRLAEVATRACTIGEPAGTTCTEALYRTGYPA